MEKQFTISTPLYHYFGFYPEKVQKIMAELIF